MMTEEQINSILQAIYVEGMYAHEKYKDKTVVYMSYKVICGLQRKDRIAPICVHENGDITIWGYRVIPVDKTGIYVGIGCSIL